LTVLANPPMRWNKLGKIFDPRDHVLSNNCLEFAQSPQALICDDFVRIYFSTRQRDASGKYLSHVSFVDMDKTFQNIIKVSSQPVIALGGLGCFDEHGIFPMNVCRWGERIYAYTTGWNRRVSVSTDAAIGLAISTDGGTTFSKVGKGPVLSATLHEPFLVGDAFVRVSRNSFQMWYIHGKKWTTPTAGAAAERIYKIAHATSTDGISWTKEGRQIISDKLGEDECQALPTVTQIEHRHHMFFCYRHATDFRTNARRAYRLGYAFSDDMVHWVRNDENIGIDVSETGWDSEMMCYPHLFEMDGDTYLLYNGNEFGRFGFGLAKLTR
jgi:hypothetical protein